MIVARTIADCRDHRADLGRVALVPTMGALHAGHLSLVAEGRRRAPRVAVSIFVNPTQFGPGEDFNRYPRPLEDDLRLCREAGVDLVFVPDAAELYPPGVPEPLLDVPALTRVLEGVHRPGHFAGVCRVVAKLFNIVRPDLACFGQKDYQQLAVVAAMTRSLDFPVEIVACPTLRDPDGMAMSSRNRYLSPAERRRGLSISRSLFEVRDAVARGERDASALQSRMLAILNDPGDAPDVVTKLDYAAIVDAANLSTVPRIERAAQALIAMRVGSTRLIDNVRLDGCGTTES